MDILFPFRAIYHGRFSTLLYLPGMAYLIYLANSALVKQTTQILERIKLEFSFNPQILEILGDLRSALCLFLLLPVIITAATLPMRATYQYGPKALGPMLSETFRSIRYALGAQYIAAWGAFYALMPLGAVVGAKIFVAQHADSGSYSDLINFLCVVFGLAAAYKLIPLLSAGIVAVSAQVPGGQAVGLSNAIFREFTGQALIAIGIPAGIFIALHLFIHNRQIHISAMSGWELAFGALLTWYALALLSSVVIKALARAAQPQPTVQVPH